MLKISPVEDWRLGFYFLCQLFLADQRTHVLPARARAKVLRVLSACLVEELELSKMPVIPPKKTEAKQPEMGEWSQQYSLLTSTLQLAVPMWIDRLRGNPWEAIQERAKVCSQHIAEHGDLILFKGKKKGESAEAFNRLAEGIACLAFCPGGVKLFGSHWEACLSEDVPKRSADSLTKLCSSLIKVLEGLKDGPQF